VSFIDRAGNADSGRQITTEQAAAAVGARVLPTDRWPRSQKNIAATPNDAARSLKRDGEIGGLFGKKAVAVEVIY
jgi:hypothetical protein